MASEQMPLRENRNRVIEREVHIEKNRKEHSGRETDTRELGTHFESLADKVKGQREGFDPKEKVAGNIVQDKEVEEAKRGREGGGGGVHHVGKFEMRDEGKGLGTEARGLRDRAELDRRTREVKGRVWSGEEKESRGKVEAEKARPKENRREDKVRDRAEIQGGTKEVKGMLGGGEGQGRENKEKAEGRNRDGGEHEGGTKEVQGMLGGGEGQGRENIEKAEGRNRVGGEHEGVTEVTTCRLDEGDVVKGRGREQEEENEQSRLEEIGKYRSQAQQKGIDAIEAANERYDRAKQQAACEALSNATQNAQGKNMHEKGKDSTIEKGQQGYVASKDVTAEKDQDQEQDLQGYGVCAKDTITNLAEKAKSAGGTTAQYAKDVTVETGKSAAKVAADLKDKAMVAGWNVAHYSTEMTVEGTKAAANAVQGAAGYAGQKASELAAKSVDTAKGLAAAAGENAKEYTARKKEEAQRELEAKRAAQNQESKEQGQGGKWEATEGGSEVLGAVGETVTEIGETMIKPAEKVQQQGEEGKGGGILGAIGETIGDIAQTTKVLVIGEGETESRQSIGSESDSHEYNRGVHGEFKHD